MLDPGERCPDCGGTLRLMGDDVAEMLELVASQLKVIETARLKKSCRRLAAAARQGAFGGSLWSRHSFRRRSRLRRGHRHLEIFERQLQLLDLPLDLLRARPELLPLELGDADPERLDQRLVGPHRRRHPQGLRPLREDDLLERGGVVRQGIGRRNHHSMLAGNGPRA